jgi:UPF0755 protein
MANKSTTVKLTLKITSFVLRLFLNIIFYILVVILIINVSKMAYAFTYQLYGPDTLDPVGSGRKIILQIKKGESTMDIASKLELNRAIKNKYSFWLKTKLQEYLIMPGTYEIYSDMTYKQILAVITDYSESLTHEEDADTGDTGTEATPVPQDGSESDSGADETGADAD